MPADVKLAASTDEVTECLVAVVTLVAVFVVIRHRDAGRSQPGGGIRTEHALTRHQLEANCQVEDGCDAIVDDVVIDIARRNLTADGGIQRAMTEFDRSEEHTSELQSLMRISYAVFCLKKNTHN